MDRWHITLKDIVWLLLLIIGFSMHWAAFQTRLGAVEISVNGPPSLEHRVTDLERAFLDIHELVKEMRNRNVRDALHDR